MQMLYILHVHLLRLPTMSWIHVVYMYICVLTVCVCVCV